MAELTIIGIDCATVPARTGLARAVLSSAGCHLTAAQLGNAGAGLIPTLVDWLPRRGRCLLALDAPLGWPAAFGSHLAEHQAGAPLPVAAAPFFRRQTDDIVARKIGKRPLDVAANLIGRTAHMALSLLAELRVRAQVDIPLAWQPDFAGPVAAIEVYPAGTLAARGWPATGYKRRDQDARRRHICERLATVLDLGDLGPQLWAQADVLDAALCILAGLDFCRGHALTPSNPVRARKEGWIWVRAPGAAVGNDTTDTGE